MPMSSATIPVEFTDPINARILAVSEDRIQVFQRDPLGEIALHHRLERDAGEARDLAKRIALKALDAILGHGEDAGVKGVGEFHRDGR